MFLKELWIYSKGLTIGFILFILLWGFINYKQGASAAPFFQYGMYANKFFITDTQQVIHLYINGKALDYTKYSMPERDLLQTPLQYYAVQQSVNENAFFTMKRILSHVYIGKLMTKEKYTNTVTDKEFTQWYLHLAERITKLPINILEAYEQKYVWKDDQLVPVSLPLKLNYIVTKP
jgi:hypothetical protein